MSAFRFLSLTPEALVTACLVLSLTSRTGAQQSSPLSGQGIPPLFAGYEDIFASTPVYTSVDLLRLQGIDDRSYEFFAVLSVQQSWLDPRAKAAFDIIDERDLFLNISRSSNVYNASLRCVEEAARANLTQLNLTSPDCAGAVINPPDCKKYCRTIGQSTDNPYRCCDSLWLPDIDLANMVDTSQDRLVYDDVTPFQTEPNGPVYVRRSTRVQGRFYTPLKVQRFPFDRQKLFIFFDIKAAFPFLNILGYHIVPSATFRHLNPDFGVGPNGDFQVSGLAKDELAGWNISTLSFSCTNTSVNILDDGSISFPAEDVNAAKLWLKDQDYADDDPYALFFNSDGGSGRFGELQKIVSTCVLTIEVSRLSSTLFAQSVLPVALVGCLSFVVFFSAPDSLDLRLSTGISLFLALTAVQFIFVSMLPLTSYLTAFDTFILLTYCTIVAIVAENIVVFYICTREEVEVRRSSSLAQSQARARALTGTGRGTGTARTSYFPSSIDLESQTGSRFAASAIPGAEGKDQTLNRTMGRNGDSAGQGSPEPGSLESTLPAVAIEGDLAADGVAPSGGEVSLAKEGLSADEARTGEVKGKKRKTARFQQPLKLQGVADVIVKVDSRFAQDSALAYRVSRMIDVAAGASLFFLYALLTILNFTVGLS